MPIVSHGLPAACNTCRLKAAWCDTELPLVRESCSYAWDAGREAAEMMEERLPVFVFSAAVVARPCAISCPLTSSREELVP